MATLQPLNEAETEWIAGLARGLRERGVAADLSTLSDFFAAERSGWSAAAEGDRYDPNPLINSVGAVVGDLLAAELGLQWVLASDEYGTEAAVFGQPCDILLYPMNAVAKRWTGQSGGTIEEFVTWTIARVREVRQSTG